MSPKGRPEGEYLSAKHERGLLTAQGHPNGEHGSAQREGHL